MRGTANRQPPKANRISELTNVTVTPALPSQSLLHGPSSRPAIRIASSRQSQRLLPGRSADNRAGYRGQHGSLQVVNAILLKPLPYPHAERIVIPWRIAPPTINVGYAEIPWGPPAVRLFQRESKTFESIAAIQPDAFILTGAGEPVHLLGVRASAAFFPVLGIRPALGRGFTSEEDQPGQEREVVLGDRLWRDRFGGAIGMYGLVSYSVTQRTREIGIRMALGAERRDVFAMVIGQGAKLALGGIAIGVPAALFATRLLASQLYGIGAGDPVTFIAVASLLLLIALLACYIPARRAMRIQPTEALRHE